MNGRGFAVTRILIESMVDRHLYVLCPNLSAKTDA